MKSSINIQPVKNNSEIHNERLKEFDYVRKDLSHLNVSWKIDSIENRLTLIKSRYFESVGQKMQSKSTPIREGVFLIKPGTTMQDCKSMSDELESKFGIKAFQIHLHRDEGHYNAETKEWKPNLHGHILFDWTDINTGKSIKLNKNDMAKVQTIVAESLGMERGVSSDKVHLNSLQYKSTKLQTELEQLKEHFKKLGEIRKELKNAASTKLEKNKLGLVNIDKTIQNIESLMLENKMLNNNILKLKVSLGDLRKENENLNRFKTLAAQARHDIFKAITNNESRPDLLKKYDLVERFRREMMPKKSTQDKGRSI
ncbi:MAG: plasmid recombination protein [bacterium]|nr:plasmid recombination protein [bacterium]